jgi:hypothetical protein
MEKVYEMYIMLKKTPELPDCGKQFHGVSGVK